MRAQLPREGECQRIGREQSHLLDETEEVAESYSDAVRAVLAGQAATMQLEASAS